ncbi:MAG: hypothetical protein MJ080_05500 [Clostridia bacterium]|nr:hypothetical protein [Clostridia bacterium]
MKRFRIVVLLVAVISFLSFSGFDSDRDFDISVGKTYEYCYADGDYDNVLARLNELFVKNSDIPEASFTKQDLKTYFNKENIQFFAINKTDASQIRVAVYEDSVSQKIEDLSSKSNKMLDDFAKDLIGDNNLQYEIYSRDAKKYIKIFETKKDEIGEYTSTQFITVCDGKVFNISFFSIGKNLGNDALKILDTFEIKEASIPSKVPVFNTVLAALGIAVLICVIIYMLWGIVKKYKQINTEKNTENEVSEVDEEKE